METCINLEERLTAIANEEPRSVRNRVAMEALDYGERPEAFFKDLLAHGCICGIVGTMTYYEDTHAFYDEHYEAIEELRVDYEEEVGTPVKIEGDLKNALAWFAFEHVAWQLAQELDLGI